MSVVTGPDNQQRLSEWIDRYERELLRLCCMILRDVPMAEDAVQETFLRAFRRMDAFRGDSEPKTWLYRIAINVCKDMRRNAWHRFFDKRVDVERVYAACEDASDISIALMQEILRLPDKLREVVFLYYYDDMKLSEIARLTGVSVSTVSDRLVRARSKLYDGLKGE